jgi:hypothetical protein
MARNPLDEGRDGGSEGGASAVGSPGASRTRAAVVEASRADQELAFLRWGDWSVRDGWLCLGSGQTSDGLRIPLSRIDEQHWLAFFVGEGASAHDVACLALALRDLRRQAGGRAGG